MDAFFASPLFSFWAHTRTVSNAPFTAMYTISSSCLKTLLASTHDPVPNHFHTVRTYTTPSVPIFLVQAAISKDHRLGCLDTYFSQFWRLVNPRSRHRHIWCLLRAYLLVHTRATSHFILAWQKEGKRALWGPFCWGTNPIHEGSTLMT